MTPDIFEKIGNPKKTYTLSEKVRQKRFHKTLKLYENRVAPDKKPVLFYLFNLFTMKKHTFFAAITTLSLLLISIYGVSHFSKSANSNQMTLELLVEKAKAAVEQEAQEGRYYHQKIKQSIDPSGIPKGIDLNQINPTIMEIWIDNATTHFIMLTQMGPDKNNQTATIYKNDKISLYNADGSLMNERTMEKGKASAKNITLDFNKFIGAALPEIIKGNKSAASLIPLFPAGAEVKEVLYIGQKEIHGEKVEILQAIGKSQGSNPQEIFIDFYFDPQTFKLKFVKILQDGQQKLEAEFLASDYSDKVPEVQLGTTTLSLVE